MKVTPQLQVEPELGKSLRRLTPDELALLESSLLAEGVRDPLVVWRRNGERVLLDGHHRYEIARRHGLDFRIEEIELADLAAAKRWVIRNQLGRRNLTPAEVAYYQGCAYLEEKKVACGWEDRDLSGAQNAHRKTCEVLAAQHGVNQANIRRDAALAAALDRQAELHGEEFRAAVLSREAKITKSEVERLDDLSAKDPEKARRIVSPVLSGQAKKDSPAVSDAHVEDSSPMRWCPRKSVTYCPSRICGALGFDTGAPGSSSIVRCGPRTAVTRRFRLLCRWSNHFRSSPRGCA